MIGLSYCFDCLYSAQRSETEKISVRNALIFPNTNWHDEINITARIQSCNNAQFRFGLSKAVRIMFQPAQKIISCRKFLIGVTCGDQSQSSRRTKRKKMRALSGLSIQSGAHQGSTAPELPDGRPRVA